MNKIILGTVQMGLPYGVNNSLGKVSVNDSISILDKAHDSGVRILDTAKVYGDAHKVIGEFHNCFPEKKFNIITKLPKVFDVDEFKATIDGYLEELIVDEIEVLMFHSFDAYFNNKKEVSSLKKTHSKIKKIGVSVYTNDEIEIIIEDDNIDVIQLPFNLLDNWSVRGGLIKRAKSKGKIIHVRSLFLQGLFFIDRNSDKSIVKSLKNQLLQIDKIANKYGFSIGELALSYAMSIEDIDSVIIGVDSEEQLIKNIKSIHTLSSNVINEINAIKVDNISLLNPSLW